MIRYVVVKQSHNPQSTPNGLEELLTRVLSRISLLRQAFASSLSLFPGDDRRALSVAPLEERAVIHHHVLAQIFKRKIGVRRLPAGATVSHNCATVLGASIFIEFSQLRYSS